MIRKNILLTLGTSSAIIVPVATLVACGSNKSGDGINKKTLSEVQKANLIKNLGEPVIDVNSYPNAKHLYDQAISEINSGIETKITKSDIDHTKEVTDKPYHLTFAEWKEKYKDQQQILDLISPDGKSVKKREYPNTPLKLIFPDGFTLPNSITDILDYGFDEDQFPSNFTLPSSVLRIEMYAFKSVKIPVSFVIPNSIEEIKGFAFENAELQAGFTIPIPLPNHTSNISKDAFGWTTDGFAHLPQGYKWSLGSPVPGSSVVPIE